jgi:hypothetical protein
VQASPSSKAGLVSQSGGLVWHIRALRHRQGLWAPFLAELGDWLALWQPPERHVLILGASAGWTIPPLFCDRFASIVCVDLDPLAPWLFRRLHPHAAITFLRRDVFTQLPELLAAYPHHAVLFSNILGQHGLHCPDPTLAEMTITQIKHRLFGRSWASYHDRLSHTIAEGALAPSGFDLPDHLPADVLAQRVGLVGECVDHLTQYALPTGPRHVMAWDINAQRRHWIEAGRVNIYGVTF